MRTLIIVSHPKLRDSYTQSFLHDAQGGFPQVTWHPLDLKYPDYRIDVAYERQLLVKHQRIIFQFPFYWYSSPALLKKWEDDVLTRSFADVRHGGYLKRKQLGLVITLGVPLKSYQAGGHEHFSLSELLTPFRALAQHTGMRFLPPFKIAQFFYQTPTQEARTLVDYQYYLTSKHLFGLSNRAHWLLRQLKALAPKGNRMKRVVFDSVLRQIGQNQDRLDDLKRQISLIRRKDEQ